MSYEEGVAVLAPLLRARGHGEERSVRLAFEYRDRSFLCAEYRRPAVMLTPAERERFHRWWLEESGLSRDELREIALGLRGLRLA